MRQFLNRAAFAVIVSALVVSGALSGETGPPEASSAPEPETGIPEGLSRGWYARIDTSMGTLIVRLLPEQAPQSVAHFAALAEGRLPWIDPFTGTEKQGHYYDGLTIHKVEMAQRFETGDPTGTGRGAPKIFVPPEGNGPVNFFQDNVVGMTRAPLGKISGTQFFVTVASQPWLTGKHPCFGKLVSGTEVAFEITTAVSDSGGKPREPIYLEKVRVFGVGDPAPLPEPEPYSPPVRRFAPID